MIGTIDQIVDFELRAARVLLPELVPKQFEVAPDLAINKLPIPAVIVLFQALLGLVQAPIISPNAARSRLVLLQWTL
jgi:hypothetical protein